jgi:ketosteroid isomerase-like protein
MSGSGATETQNIAVVRRGYEAFAKGDIETLKALFTADANWHALRVGVLPGNYRGVQAILGFFGQLAQETEGTMRVEPVTMAASGDSVFVFQRITGTRKGKTLDTQAVLFFTVANGVVTEVKEFPADYPAYSHFWS